MKRDHVVSARNERGWSQEDLARRASVSSKTIGRIEKGASVTERVAEQVASALGKSTAWFFGPGSRAEASVMDWDDFRERVREALGEPSLDPEVEDRLRFAWELYSRRVM